MSYGKEIVIKPDKDLYFTDPDKWFEGLIYFLYTNIISKIIPNTDLNRDKNAKLLLSPPTYERWKACFTHATFNPNQDSNYEVPEKIGDTVAGTTFMNFQRNKNPHITQDVISQLKAKYMSKEEQRKKSDALGLKDWVRIVKDWTQSVSEDLFESLYGTIFIVGNEILEDGDGYALANNLMIYMYKDDVFDLNYKDATTKIKEIFEKMHWSDYDQFKMKEIGDAIENKNARDYNSKWSIVLRLTPKAKDYIVNKRKVELTTDILASYVGGNKDFVKNKAYEDALEKLKEYGISTEFANKFVEEEEEKFFDENSKNRMILEGFRNLYFSKNIKSREYQLIQLIGIDDKHVERILLTVTGKLDVPIQNIKEFAIRTYNKYGAVEWYKPQLYQPLIE
jgi:dsRNA-specific ribonuclease